MTTTNGDYKLFAFVFIAMYALFFIVIKFFTLKFVFILRYYRYEDEECN